MSQSSGYAVCHYAVFDDDMTRHDDALIEQVRANRSAFPVIGTVYRVGDTESSA